MQASTHASWRRVCLFLGIQSVLLSAAVAATAHRWYQRQALRALPPLRSTPFRVEPRYDYPWMVTDEQLELVLRKLYPRLRGARPKINFVDHAYRLWGPDAVFDDPQALSGKELREVLLNHQRFAELWPGSPPLLMLTDNGIEIRTQEGRSTASHTDHTLACLSESGLPLDYPIVTPEGRATLRDLLETSLRKFSLDQMEYEWSAVAYALSVPPVRRWYSTEGQELTFDRLADRIMRQELGEGVCFGQHRMHALVAFLRIHEQTPILTPEGHARIIAYLKDVTRRLIGSQHPYGYWEGDWTTGKPPQATNADKPENDLIRDRVIATGHILEWLALAPEEVHPPREVLVRASQWAVTALERWELAQLQEQYAFATHLGSALALWRGCRPAEFMKNRQATARVNKPEKRDS